MSQDTASLAVLAFAHSQCLRRVETAHADIVDLEQRIGELRKVARENAERAEAVFQQMQQFYAEKAA